MTNSVSETLAMVTYRDAAGISLWQAIRAPGLAGAVPRGIPAAFTQASTASRQRFAPVCDRFRADLLEGTLAHDGRPLLARHVAHAIATRTPHGVAIEKAHADSPRRIDAAVAAVIAHDRAGWHAANPVEPFMLAW